jgi:hypothetical protein
MQTQIKGIRRSDSYHGRPTKIKILGFSQQSRIKIKMDVFHNKECKDKSENPDVFPDSPVKEN